MVKEAEREVRYGSFGYCFSLHGGHFTLERSKRLPAREHILIRDSIKSPQSLLHIISRI